MFLYGPVASLSAKGKETKKTGGRGIFIADYLGAVGKVERSCNSITRRSQMFAYFSGVVNLMAPEHKCL
jgi:hypothetical protein